MMMCKVCGSSLTSEKLSIRVNRDNSSATDCSLTRGSGIPFCALTAFATSFIETLFNPVIRIFSTASKGVKTVAKTKSKRATNALKRVKVTTRVCLDLVLKLRTVSRLTLTLLKNARFGFANLRPRTEVTFGTRRLLVTAEGRFTLARVTLAARVGRFG